MLRLKRWAVLGASANPEKVSFRIFKLLRRYGYETYPVNPKETVIDGQPCFPALRDLPVLPEVVDLVVPPAVALEALVECQALGLKNVWLQPGVNTPEVIAKARELGLNVVFDACAMVESSKLAMLRKKAWAVIDASNGQTEEAETISQYLQQRGYDISLLTINSASEHDAAELFASLAVKPEAVIIAGQPSLAAEALQACKAAGLEFVWLQPGTETEELIALAISLHLIIVHHASVIDEWEAVKEIDTE